MTARAQITAERLELFRDCLNDGWSFNQIRQTYGPTWKTLNRHFPRKGWTKKQGAELGYLVMKAGKT